MLLHILLELDCRRAPPPPPVRALLSPEHGWLPVLDKLPPAAAESGSAAATAAEAESPAKKTLQGPSQQQQQNGAHANGGGAYAHVDQAANGGSGATAAGSTAAAEAADSAEPPELEQPLTGPEQAASSARDGSKGAGGKGGSSNLHGGGKSELAGASGQLPVLTCGLEDVGTLAAHWDAFPEAWRASIRAGCEVLRDALARAGAYTPGTLQQLQVRRSHHHLSPCLLLWKRERERLEGARRPVSMQRLCGHVAGGARVRGIVHGRRWHLKQALEPERADVHLSRVPSRPQ